MKIMVTVAVKTDEADNSGWRERTLTIAGQDAPAEWLATFPSFLKRALEDRRTMLVASGSAADDELIEVEVDE